jgi:hypothetical protein
MYCIRRLTVITGLLFATLAQAQAPASHQPPEQPLPLLFKEAWKPTPTPTAVLLSQAMEGTQRAIAKHFGG